MCAERGATDLEETGIVAYPDDLDPAVEGQENGDGGGPAGRGGIDGAVVEIETADAVAVLDLGSAKDRAQLGEGVEGDGPVAQDTGLGDARQQEDLLDSRARAVGGARGLGPARAQAGGEDEGGRAGGIVGIGGDAEEVEELGGGGADIEVAVWTRRPGQVSQTRDRTGRSRCAGIPR